MRARLGAPILLVDSVCGCCGSQRMDTKVYHALCCALAESIVVHNRTRNCLADCIAQADPGTAIEVPGLCPVAPNLCPADILTTAAHPTLAAAVDLGIRASHAPTAGGDPLGSLRSDKFAKHERHLSDLASHGISFEPAIFSAHGRRRPRATDMIRLAAAKAARRNGSADGSRLLTWWFRQLGAEVWRRAVWMILACVPHRTEQGGNSQDIDEDDFGDTCRSSLRHGCRRRSKPTLCHDSEPSAPLITGTYGGLRCESGWLVY